MSELFRARRERHPADLGRVERMMDVGLFKLKARWTVRSEISVMDVEWWEGDGCAGSAIRWLRSDRSIRVDYSAEEGWPERVLEHIGIDLSDKG